MMRQEKTQYNWSAGAAAAAAQGLGLRGGLHAAACHRSRSGSAPSTTPPATPLPWPLPRSAPQVSREHLPPERRVRPRAALQRHQPEPADGQHPPHGAQGHGGPHQQDDHHQQEGARGAGRERLGQGEGGCGAPCSRHPAGREEAGCAGQQAAGAPPTGCTGAPPTARGPGVWASVARTPSMPAWPWMRAAAGALTVPGAPAPPPPPPQVYDALNPASQRRLAWQVQPALQ